MRILHYSLGFPPYRSGGLVKFCVDLMRRQAEDGHDVLMLWPGTMRLFFKKTKIGKKRSVQLGTVTVSGFEIINPLPVPYDEGIRDFRAFSEEGDSEYYETWLRFVCPDVIHVHTLMGLQKGFLDAAKRCGIRTVFTAHDFFPICAKVTLFSGQKNCVFSDDCRNCPQCNRTALSVKKISVLQSPLYRRLKDTAFIKKLRKRHRDEYLNGQTVSSGPDSLTETPEDFRKLREHYRSMLEQMDKIHYNSELTRETYESYFGKMDFVTIPVTHGDIADFRKRKKFSDREIRIRYLGPYSEAKGIGVLSAALARLWEERKNFRLDVHFTFPDAPEYVRMHPRYSYSELPAIFEETDVLLAPSFWRETFGFTVLEALSYGVPVIISDSVGAKDILTPGGGRIFSSGNPEELFRCLRDLTSESLAEMNRIISERQRIPLLSEAAEKIEAELYRK